MPDQRGPEQQGPGQPSVLVTREGRTLVITIDRPAVRNAVDVETAHALAGALEETAKAWGPLDILVNGRLIARGEAVVVNDKFGIRLTDIVSRSERIARLR